MFARTEISSPRHYTFTALAQQSNSALPSNPNPPQLVSANRALQLIPPHTVCSTRRRGPAVIAPRRVPDSAEFAGFGRAVRRPGMRVLRNTRRHCPRLARWSPRPHISLRCAARSWRTSESTHRLRRNVTLGSYFLFALTIASYTGGPHPALRRPRLIIGILLSKTGNPTPEPHIHRPTFFDYYHFLR